MTATVSLIVLNLPSNSSRVRDAAAAGDVTTVNPWSTSRCVHLELRVGPLDVLSYPTLPLALSLKTESAPPDIVGYVVVNLFIK